MFNKKYFMYGFFSVVVILGAFVVERMFRNTGEVTWSGTGAQMKGADWNSVNAGVNDLIKQKNTDKAVELLNGFLKENPRFLPAVLRLSDVYLQKGDFARSRQLLLDEDRVSPGESMVNVQLADTYLKENDFDNAMKFGTKALESAKNPKEHVRAHQILAWIYYRTEKFEEAKNAVAKVLEIEPDHALIKTLQEKLSSGTQNPPKK